MRRIRRVMDFTRSLSAFELLAEIMPGGTPARVVADIARHCRFAHGSVMVFPSVRPAGRTASTLSWRPSD
ncbi:hypothetical protein GCM10023191_045100 [Actinoallomurus oryzae]|uniref:Uncharacterized protein n=1 Tax=Actinoallomurus oryzae TaxID=502180 RepID=A0ABP8Q8M5_9ACTN